MNEHELDFDAGNDRPYEFGDETPDPLALELAAAAAEEAAE